MRHEINLNRLVLILLILASARQSFAFPELVRHGYVNCTTCHLSPTGGGALTEYGRELSKELLSKWSYEGEQKYFYAIKAPENVAAGGDIRYIYLYRNTPALEEGKWTFMQADLEDYVAIANRKLWFGGSVGIQQPDPTIESYKFISRRHYINYRPTDELSIRAGKFAMAYGINTPDHAITIKRDLGWDQGNESYNLESAWIGENWNYNVTANFGRPDEQFRNAETGFSTQVSRAFLERMKVGGSFFYGDTPTQYRKVFGPFGIIGFTKQLFLLSEVDFQWLKSKTSNAPQQSGYVTYNRLGYEVFQGLIPYITHELSYLNQNDSNSNAGAFGAGVQFFPRPHLEANVFWQKRRSSAFNQKYTDLAWIMLHFYP